MKVCRECNVDKPLSEFYKHEKMGDGYLNKCKSCVKSRVKKHRNENLEKAREYDKKRSMLPHRVQARKEYQETERGKEALRRARKNYRKKYPLAYAAHIVTRNAIRDGKLKPRKTCVSCKKNGEIHAHHDDYTRPLSVRWLCIKCHVKWHKENTPIYE
jgi:hypothetical protein